MLIMVTVNNNNNNTVVGPGLASCFFQVFLLSCTQNVRSKRRELFCFLRFTVYSVVLIPHVLPRLQLYTFSIARMSYSIYSIDLMMSNYCQLHFSGTIHYINNNIIIPQGIFFQKKEETLPSNCSKVTTFVYTQRCRKFNPKVSRLGPDKYFFFYL